MSFEHNAHIQPFAWTRPHLRALCSDIQSALEEWATRDAPEAYADESEMLEPARDAASRMQATLALLGTSGGASLAEALVHVIQALSEGREKDREETINLALEAVAILPDYLDRLETGGTDAPIILLPLINDLRACTGESLLSEDSLFNPDLSLLEPPAPEVEAIDPRMLRRRYEIALLNWLKAEDDPREALEAIDQVLDRLRKAGLDGIEIERMAWAAQAVVAGLMEGTVQDGPGLRRIFARLDVLLRSLVRHADGDESEVAISEQADAICRGMLFHAALAEPGCEPVDGLVEQTRLRELLPERLELEKARSSLSGRNRGVFASVAGAVQEELGHIKQELDLYLRGEETAPDHVQTLTGMLANIGETLSMLGLNRMSERVGNQAGRLENLSGNPDDPELLDVAHQLLLVENELDDSIGYMGETPDVEPAAGTSLLPENERRRVLRQLIAESLEDLQQAKHLLDSIHKNETDVSSASQVTKLLSRISGAFRLGGLEEAARLTSSNEAFIRAEILEAEKLPGRERMEGLAESLTDLEFYIESLPRMDGSGQRFLDHARRRLTQLGYWSETEETEATEEETGLELADDGEIEEFDAADILSGEAADEAAAMHSGDTAEQADDEPVEPDHETGRVGDEPEKIGAEPSLTGESGLEEHAVGDEDEFDVRDIFLEELEHERGELHSAIESLQANPGDNEVLTRIRRSFHTIKGSGRMVGETEIGEFAWSVENMLNQALEGKLEPTSIIDLTRKCIETLDALEDRLRDAGPGPEEQELATLVDQVNRAAEGHPVTAEAAEQESVEPAGEPADASEDLDPTLVQLMVNELSENLDALEAYLADAEERGWPGTVQSDLVRSVHTMKGTLRLAPLGNEGEAAQELENYLNELAMHSEAPDAEGVRCISSMAGLFRARLQRLEGEAIGEARFRCDELTGSFRRLLHDLREKERGLSRADAEPASSDYPDDEESIFRLGDEAAESRHQPTSGSASADDEYVFSIDEEEPAGATPEADDAPDHAPPAAVGSDEEAEPPAPETGEPEAEEPVEFEQPEESEPEEVESWDSLDLDEEWDRSGELEELKATADEQADPETSEEIEASLEPVDEEESPGEPAPESSEWTDREAPFEPSTEFEPADDTEPDETRAPDDESRTEPQAPATISGTGTEAIDFDYEQVDRELAEVFLEEGNELLERSDELIQEWRQDLSSPAVVTGLQRNLHTIKGSARMAGFNPVGEVAHVMEELLEAIAGGQTQATEEAVSAIELGCDHLHTMLDAIARQNPIPVIPLSELTAEADMDAEIAQPIEDELAPAPQAVGDDRPAEARRDTLRVDADLVDDLVNYAGEISIFRSRLEQQVSVFRTNVTEVDSTVIRLRDQLRKLELETEAQILARYEREHGALDEAFDPLELDRYSNIQQLSRALAESVTDLTSLTQILDDATRQSETLLMQQSRVNTELQEGLMQARLVSFATLEPRLRRVVRNACRDTGKNARLDVRHLGESELDRNILDRISAPLEHMLRNAVAHGIEDEAARRQAGKPEAGTVTVEVDRESTEMVIRVMDDGGGLDRERIRRAAVEKGLLDADSRVSDEEIYQYILESGFSTAEEVSELAGRGVGMDVVANEIRQIGGTINLRSEHGRGARFTIRIPLTLAVMQAIMVRAADRTFAIPLQAVRGVARMMSSDYERVMAEPNPEYEYAGETYPLMELEPQLGLETPPITGNTVNLLMIQAGEERAAFHITELLGHREIVIKPVGPQISSIPGILSGTITGDGQVVLILDMGPLIHRGIARLQRPGTDEEIQRPAAPAEEVKRTPLVLIVDDSITMRRITSRVLENRELEVLTAKDGLDAIEVMYDRIPDLMLLDIEMPRMDGYELTTHVRNDPRLKGIPIMMITSRTGEKHRQHALELGVNRYLSKPYQEAELVRNVFEMLKLPAPEV